MSTQRVHPANPSTIQSCDSPKLGIRAWVRTANLYICNTMCVVVAEGGVPMHSSMGTLQQVEGNMLVIAGSVIQTVQCATAAAAAAAAVSCSAAEICVSMFVSQVCMQCMCH